MIRTLRQLWHRAAPWRVVLMATLACTVLAVLYPPWMRARYIRPSDLLKPGIAPIWTPPVSTRPVRGQYPVPAGPQPPAHDAARLVPDERSGSGSGSDDETSFYAVPPAGPDDAAREADIAAQEVSMRRLYTDSAPAFHHEIPLPPGVWTAVAIGPEAGHGVFPDGMGELMARIEAHRVTGVMLIRLNMKPPFGPLPSNPACHPAGRLAFRMLGEPKQEARSCMFVPPPQIVDATWRAPKAPPALRIGWQTLNMTGDTLPTELTGATYFRISGLAWIEVTTWFDPSRNRAGPGESDAAAAAFTARLWHWMEGLLPTLDHLTPQQLPHELMRRLNAGVPN